MSGTRAGLVDFREYCIGMGIMASAGVNSAYSARGGDRCDTNFAAKSAGDTDAADRLALARLAFQVLDIDERGSVAVDVLRASHRHATASGKPASSETATAAAEIAPASESVADADAAIAALASADGRVSFDGFQRFVEKDPVYLIRFRKMFWKG